MVHLCVLYILYLQGDKLNMTVFSGVTFLVYTCTLAYTGKVAKYEVPEKHGHV